MSTSAGSGNASVIATGLFTAGGVLRHVNAGQGTVVTPRGTFKVRHSRGTGSQQFDPKTCLLTVRDHGTYKLSGGTGRYRGITGHGRYRVTILVVSARSHGRCAQNKPPAAFQQIIRASGPARR